jgi:hypothetical protein
VLVLVGVGPVRCVDPGIGGFDHGLVAGGCLLRLVTWLGAAFAGIRDLPEGRPEGLGVTDEPGIGFDIRTGLPVDR